MTQNNNGNGTQRPKLDPELYQEVRVRLLRDKAFIGKNSNGSYYLYSVLNVETSEELAFFAPQEIHNIIVEKKLGKGSEFLIKKVPSQNGNKKGSKLELSLLSTIPPSNGDDNLKEIMLKSIKDAVEIVNNSGVQFNNEELQRFATTLFIARANLS